MKVLTDIKAHANLGNYWINGFSVIFSEYLYNNHNFLIRLLYFLQLHIFYTKAFCLLYHHRIRLASGVHFKDLMFIIALLPHFTSTPHFHCLEKVKATLFFYHFPTWFPPRVLVSNLLEWNFAHTHTWRRQIDNTFGFKWDMTLFQLQIQLFRCTLIMYIYTETHAYTIDERRMVIAFKCNFIQKCIVSPSLQSFVQDSTNKVLTME